MIHTHINLQKNILHNHIQQIIDTTPLHTNLAQNQHTKIKDITHHIKLIQNPHIKVPINPTTLIDIDLPLLHIIHHQTKNIHHIKLIQNLPQNHILIDPIPNLLVLIQEAHIEDLQHVLVHPQNLTEKNNKLRFVNNR